jgi:hypothetical protein
MCTVVIRVPVAGSTEPVRILAVRDEDPGRPWRPLGEWWDDRPGVRGVLDELAGGAWLAADDRKLAVLLNRAGAPRNVEVPTTRGALVLDAVADRPLPDPLTTLGFNLVEATADRVRVTSWTGDAPPAVVDLVPGTHMIAHDDVDDARTARVAAWHDAFAAAGTQPGAEGCWWDDWLRVLALTTEVGPTDDRAIIRDNRPFGYPTMSLLVAAASIGAEGVDVRTGTLDVPGEWNEPGLTTA